MKMWCDPAIKVLAAPLCQHEDGARCWPLCCVSMKMWCDPAIKVLAAPLCQHEDVV